MSSQSDGLEKILLETFIEADRCLRRQILFQLPGMPERTASETGINPETDLRKLAKAISKNPWDLVQLQWVRTRLLGEVRNGNKKNQGKIRFIIRQIQRKVLTKPLSL